MADGGVAVVVGGGSGMGADAARRLRDDGFDIAVLSSSGKGEALAAELGGLGYTGSNRNVDDLSMFVEQVMGRWGRIDAVVNSAGHGPKGELLELADEDWHLGMEVYLLHVVRMTRLVAPIMLRQGGGSIVNVSTYATFEPDPAFPTSGVFRAGLAAYAVSATDALVVGITAHLATVLCFSVILAAGFLAAPKARDSKL